MPIEPPPVVKRYFEHDANRDIEAIVALFTDDATVIDEGLTRRGIREIRNWQTGAASKYHYTTTTGGEPTAPDSYRGWHASTVTSPATRWRSNSTSPSRASESSTLRSRPEMRMALGGRLVR